MKRIIMIMIILTMIAHATLCEDRSDANTECVVSTPVLTCSSNATLLNVETGDTSEYSMVSTGLGVYNFSINLTDGDYVIVLCDNTSSQISVRDTLDTKLSNVNTTLISDISSVNDSVTSTNTTLLSSINSLNNIVSSLATQDNVTTIITTGNSNWTTSTLNSSTVSNAVWGADVTSYNVSGTFGRWASNVEDYLLELINNVY